MASREDYDKETTENISEEERDAIDTGERKTVIIVTEQLKRTARIEDSFVEIEIVGAKLGEEAMEKIINTFIGKIHVRKVSV